MAIEIINEFDQSPPNICPHCKKELHLVIDAFRPDITKIVRSNCVHCGGEIFAGLFIITDKSMRHLLENIQAVINLFNESNANVTTVDNPANPTIQ